MFTVKVNDSEIHSFQILAANEGGWSFPSETLALREGGDNPVLIVNGFTRVSAPESRTHGDIAGFYTSEDFGVPYIRDISFIGNQTEFRKSSGDNFGKSDGNYATQVIAGNTFDYPYIHGKSIARTGRGFISTSVGAVEDGMVDLDKYQIVDLILGKQKATTTGFGSSGVRFTAFPAALQKQLTKFIKGGGDLLVTGTYVSSDLFNSNSPSGSKSFANDVLGLQQSSSASTQSGQIRSSNSSFGVKNINYSNTLNEKDYIVQNPDVLQPYGNAKVLYQYSDMSLPAMIMNKKGKSNIIISSIPFEVISEDQRDSVMKDLLNNLSN